MNKRALIFATTMVLLAFAIVMTITTEAAHADLVVSGAGNGSANGCYVDQEEDPDGVDNTWLNEDTGWLIMTSPDTDDSYCLVNNGSYNPMVGPQYYMLFNSTPGLACTEITATGTYSAAVGTPPGPSVEIIDTCDTPEPPATTTATTTPGSNPNQDLFYGFILFFLSAGFVIWTFKKNV